MTLSWKFLQNAIPLLLVVGTTSAMPLTPRQQHAYYRPGYNTCLAGAHAVRPIEHCTAEEIAFQTGVVEARYRERLASTKGRAHARLVESQRSWQARMDAKCEIFSRRRGSLNSMKAQDCFLAETINRRAQLEREGR